MANLKKIKAIIDYIIEKEPELAIMEDISIAAEYGEIYLPIPNGVSEEELEQKGKELNFSIEENSIVIYV